MRCSKLTLCGFTTFSKPTTLRFPETGVVLLTGPNGCGKSSIADAVSVALWGSPVRPTSVWNTACEYQYVELETDYLSLHVSRTKAPKAALAWSGDHQVTQQYDTVTKAQTALSSVLPVTQATWKAAHVFRSFDVGSLSRATDEVRKVLLEELGGLNAFSDASKAAKAETTAQKSLVQSLSLGLTRDASALASHTDWLKNQVESTLLMRKSYVTEVEKLTEALREHDAQVTALEKAKRDFLASSESEDALVRAVAEAQNDVATIKRAITQAKQNYCFACNRPLSTATSEVSLQKLQEQLQHAERVYGDVQLRMHKHRLACQKLDNEIGQRILLRSEVNARLSALKTAGTGNEEENLLSCASTVASFTATLTRTFLLVRAAERRLALLEEVEKVLGFQGLRSTMLHDLLKLLTDEANYWLSLLCDNIQVEFSPTTTTSSGAVRDKISMAVSGVGNGLGYFACSDGEQRRIDLATTFALSSLSPVQGTMFIDECFDSLHHSGVVSAVEALGRIAKTRCVVLTTHRQDIVELIKPVAHYRFVAPGVLG